jgi:hypothetical protein
MSRPDSRRAAALLSLLLLAACGDAQVVMPASGTGPVRLVCAEPEFDFGSVWEGTLVEHRFVLDVEGEGELALQAVRGSCGCTVGQLTRAGGEDYVYGTPLSAGEQLWLDVRFNSQGRIGVQDRAVTLYGNLPGDGREAVRLVGEVGAYLRPEQEELEVGRLLSDGEAISSVRLTTADGEPVRVVVQDMPPLPADLHAQAVAPDGRSDAPSCEWVLAVRLSPSERFGAFHYPVRVDTLDAEGNPSDVGATVFVAWTRVRPYEASPPAFSLGLLRPDEPAEARVVLRTNVESSDAAALDPAAALVELDGPAAAFAQRLRVEAWSEGGERGLRLVTDGLPAELEGRILGRVRLPLEHPLQPSLVVPIEARLGPVR